MPFKQVLDPATGEMVWEKMSADEAAAAAAAKAAQMGPASAASKLVTDVVLSASLSASASNTTRNIIYAQVPVAPSAGAADEDAAAPSVLDLKLDAYLPPATSCTSPQGWPAVVLIHGTCATVQQSAAWWARR